MKIFSTVVLPLVAASLLNSCASIISGSTQTIEVSSQPSGARVSLEDVPMGTTPTELTLSRKKSHRVNIDHPGYQGYEVILQPAGNSMTGGNLLAGGLVGAMVDNSTGANIKLVPSKIDAVLKKR